MAASDSGDAEKPCGGAYTAVRLFQKPSGASDCKSLSMNRRESQEMMFEK